MNFFKNNLRDGVDTSIVTAGAEDVLSPKVIVGADGQPIVGTIPSLEEATWSSGIEEQIIPAGTFLLGNQIIRSISDVGLVNFASGEVTTSVSKTAYSSNGSEYTSTKLNCIEVSGLSFAPKIVFIVSKISMYTGCYHKNRYTLWQDYVKLYAYNGGYSYGSIVTGNGAFYATTADYSNSRVAGGYQGGFVLPVTGGEATTANPAFWIAIG